MKRGGRLAHNLDWHNKKQQTMLKYILTKLKYFKLASYQSSDSVIIVSKYFPRRTTLSVTQL